MSFKASLRWKISLFLVVLVLGSVLLTGWLISKSFNVNFKKYLLKSYEAQTENFLSVLQEAYQLAGNWGKLVNSPEGRRLLFFNPSLVSLEDTQGRTLLQPGMGRKHSHRKELSNRNAKPYPVVVENKVVGRVWLLGPNPSGLITQADVAFQQSINRTIILSILLLGVIALALGLWGANSLIIRRLEKLRQAVTSLAAGDLKTKTRDPSRDELGELTNDFNKMAERLLHLEELKKTYLAETAHELRTPLTTIRSHLEAFQDGVLEADQETLALVLEEVMNLTSLLNDLQDLASSTGLLKNIRSLPVNLSLALSNLTEKFRPVAAEQSLDIITDLPGEPLYIQGDPEAITKIMNNLFTNAIKFSPPGGKIFVLLIKEKNRVKFSITDQGIGIKKEDLPNIFDRFYRVDPSRSRQTGGSGLGLAIVKELTTAMGGEVKVKSEPESGSVFTLTFPELLQPV
jgi:signal transduction histidine kinase